MEYSFNIFHAQKFGLEEAIMLKNFIHWIRSNKANNSNFHEGKTWTYNSIRAFEDLFPFMKPKQIRYTLESLLNQGVLVKGNHNNFKNNRTLWYALADEAMLELDQDEFPFAKIGKCISQKGQMDLPKRANAFAKKGKCLSDINTDINTDVKHSVPAVLTEPQVFVEKFGKIYTEVTKYPFKAKKEHFIIATDLIKLYGLQLVIDKARILAVHCQLQDLWFTKQGWADFSIEKLTGKWNEILPIEKMDPKKKETEDFIEAFRKAQEHDERLKSQVK